MHCSKFVISFVPDWKQLVKFLHMAMVGVHYHLKVVFASSYICAAYSRQSETKELEIRPVKVASGRTSLNHK